MPFAATWMDLENTKGYIVYDSIYMKCPEQANPQTQKADQWLPGAGSGGSGMNSDCLMGTGFLFVMLKMFWNQILVMVAQYCECTKSH